MAPTLTTKLSLSKPDPNDLYDISIVNGNSDKIDTAIGITFCTSSTRPATPYVGQQIYETDTKRSWVWQSPSWVQLVAPPIPLTLTDGATISTDVTDRRLFRVTMLGNRTLGATTGAVDGQQAMWALTASGGARTVTLATGAAQAFKFGTTITSASITATASGTTDYIGAVYDSTAQRWHVISYVKGL